MDARVFDDMVLVLGRSRDRRRFLIVMAAIAGAVLGGGRDGAAGECTPQCDGRVCGPDGCGGSCGTCPVGSNCETDLGICDGDPPICSDYGEWCHFEQPCCPEWHCVNEVCVDGPCRLLGDSCTDGLRCCSNLVCLDGLCVPSPGDCVATGGRCEDLICCDLDDTCSANPEGVLICQPTAPIRPGCVHAGKRLRRGETCCPRLHAERGRCVINRWDACKNRRGRREQCERGTRCQAGRLSPDGRRVCVPVGKGLPLDLMDIVPLT